MTNQSLDLNVERWNWRGSANSEVNLAIAKILGRISLDSGNSQNGYTATRILVEKLFDSRDVSNKQIIAAANLKIDDFSEPNPTAITDKYPQYYNFSVHKQAVDAMSMITGISKQTISNKLKGLGFTGTPGALVTVPTEEKLRLGTIVHDITTYIDEAIKTRDQNTPDPQFEGIASFNKSVFGVEDIKLSAIAMTAENLFESGEDILENAGEVLEFLGYEAIEALNQELEVDETIKKLGEVGSTIGAKLARFYGDGDASLVLDLLGKTTGKTIAELLKTTISNQFVGTSLKTQVIYEQFALDFKTKALNMANAAMKKAFQEAFDITDPLAEAGINNITKEFTNYVFSELAITTLGEDVAEKYFGIDPNIDFTKTFQTIATEILTTGFGVLKNFIGSQLFNWLDEQWESVDLDNEGAAFGGLLGSLIVPGIGSFLGSVIGGWIWDIIADEDPRAYYVVKLNGTNQIITQFSFEEDDGRIDVAQQMGESVKDTLNLIVGMIGGTPTEMTAYEYGHYEEEFIFDPPDASRFSFDDIEVAINQGIVSQLKTLKIEGGDPYMKKVASLPNYNPSLEQLFTDLGVAKEYSVHKTDPVLYGQMILNFEDVDARQYLLDDWRRIQNRSIELQLNTLPENNGGDFIAGTVGKDTLDGKSGDDFIYGGAGNDLLIGGAGNDRLDSGDGTDTLEGNDGDDVFVKSYSGTIKGGYGNDLLIADYSNYDGYSGYESGISNLVAGTIYDNQFDYEILLTYSEIEHFNIKGSQFNDHLKAKAGDIMDGNGGKDTLHLDLTNAISAVVVDFNQTNALVSYGSTQISNFEQFSKISTGSSNDTIKLSTSVSLSDGTIDASSGNDLLIADYSSYDGYSGYESGISNLVAGTIYDNQFDYEILLTYKNVERFNLIGSQFHDHLQAKAGDIMDAKDGKDKLALDLATATTAVVLDLTQTNAQVIYGSTQISNFEILGDITTGSASDTIKTSSQIVGKISTGSGNDTIKTSFESSGGTIDAGIDNDLLIADYSSYDGYSGYDSGISNLVSGTIYDNQFDYEILLTYNNVERFNITGSQFDDHLKAKAGNIIDGNGGEDVLDLDLATATTSVIVDFNQTNALVSYGSTQISNFEQFSKISTGSSNDTIKLSTSVSVSDGTIDASSGNDLLIADYSSYDGYSGYESGISNLVAGTIYDNQFDYEILLTYKNVERFNLIGSQFDDHLQAKAGDIMDAKDGKDKLALDLATATTAVVLDLTQTNAQVIYGSTQISNFEILGDITTGSASDTIKTSSQIVGKISTGSSNDTIKTSFESSGGTIDAGIDNDLLIADYSSYDGYSGYDSGISNLVSGTIYDNQFDYEILLTYNNVEFFNITGSTFKDELYGGNLNDTLSGNAGNDVLVGNNGNDTLNGGLGNDTLKGDTGNDLYVVDSTADVIQETNSIATEIDTVQSSVSHTLGIYLENLTLTGIAHLTGVGNNRTNLINGNTGNNLLDGSGGKDTINGGAGNDSLNGGSGNDSLNGGIGNDTYIVDNPTDVVLETSTITTEIDTVQTNINFTLGNNLENITLIGLSHAQGIGNSRNNLMLGNTGNNLLDGGTGNDTLNGGIGNDTLNGGAGNDSLIGDIGNDSLNGGLGNDTINGGIGNDIYVVDSIADVVQETSTITTEIDTVQTNINYTLGSNLDNLILTGTNNILGVGNSRNNSITGNNGNNTLNGGAGNDTLNGGLGSDSFRFNTGAAYNTTAVGVDTITDFTVGSDKIVLSKATFTTISSNVGTGFSNASEFAGVTTFAQSETSAADIVYNSSSDRLFYNQNGTAAGFGTGGAFAAFLGDPNLTASNFSIIA